MLTRGTVAVVLLLAAATAPDALYPVWGATSSTIDILPDSVTNPQSEAIEVGRVKPLDAPARVTTRPVTGNPLWSVPLSALTATQERPIFSASRRPPPRVITGPQVVPVAPVSAPPPPEPERPSLTLIGAVVGDDDAVAVFIDRVTQGIVRMRSGDNYGGWQLSALLPREATLTRANRVEVLTLQRLDGVALKPAMPPPPAPALPPMATSPPQAATGVVDPTGYAPFTPRSTPKNGESDGL